MNQVFLASRPYQVATLVAAIRQGLLPPATRRILVLSDTAIIPETNPLSLRTSEVIRALAISFDEVRSLNDDLAPYLPGTWFPRADDQPILQRLFEAAWGVGGGPLHLFVESIQGPPAKTFMSIFPEARLTVYADGLMAYGPTRVNLHPHVASRIDTLLIPDLLDGVRPALLRDHGVEPTFVQPAALKQVFAELAENTAVLGQQTDHGPVGVVLGQYMSSLGILSDEEEFELHCHLIRSVTRSGLHQVLFKPHPGAPPTNAEDLTAWAAAEGIELAVCYTPELVELLYESLDVRCVAACFSTGLATASALYGIEALRGGTRLVLERLRPFQNSNRVPAILADVRWPRASRERPTMGPDDRDELQRLVDAMAYVIQPGRYLDHQEVAEAFVAANPELRNRFVPIQVQRRLDLPGAPGRWQRPYNVLYRPPISQVRARLEPLERRLRPGLFEGVRVDD